MEFDENQFTVEELTLENETIRFRAFRNLVYVGKPVNEDYQRMNLFAPEDYYEGKKINGYDLHTAPVFMPNTVGGYMPGGLDERGYNNHGPKRINSIFKALQHGYVVAVPAIRGRIQQDEKGVFIGKAPACVVDYKAAVRYLHFFSDQLPGDESKIITNGTSTGGALSSLMGATGNHPDYEVYLRELEAAEAGDEVFAASCYCPITNLDHADSAYEWEFYGVNTYHRIHMKLGEAGRPDFIPMDGEMTEIQIKTSKEEAEFFPDYVNSLRLQDKAGNSLVLDKNGEGSFKEYIISIVRASAQRALDKGIDISDKTWIRVEDRKVVDLDFGGYVRDITRMKTAPAFDDLTMDSPENNLFGTAKIDCCHFTEYSLAHSQVEGVMADSLIVKMMNPMNYIEDDKADTAQYWRIRHGECDRDTSLAISAILALKLENCGCNVDYHSPWNVPHSGDYDLDELFVWIDEICRGNRES